MKQTIIFIHGMFQNDKSWAKWVNYFSARGYNCVTKSWPLHDGEPADLRLNIPEGLGDLHLKTVVAEFESLAAQHDKPILIGHSVGGLITQLLVSKGIAGAGVCIDSVAPNMMLAFDWGFFKNSASIANPFAGNKPFEMTAEGFHANFANTMSEDASNAEYEKSATHDSRNMLRDCMGSDGHIDLDLPHAPLLFIGGEKDQIIPPELNEKNAKGYKDENSIADFKEFENRGHYICGEPGWEEIAAYIENWLENVLNTSKASSAIA